MAICFTAIIFSCYIDSYLEGDTILIPNKCSWGEGEPTILKLLKSEIDDPQIYLFYSFICTNDLLYFWCSNSDKSRVKKINKQCLTMLQDRTQEHIIFNWIIMPQATECWSMTLIFGKLTSLWSTIFSLVNTQLNKIK